MLGQFPCSNISDVCHEGVTDGGLHLSMERCDRHLLPTIGRDFRRPDGHLGSTGEAVDTNKEGMIE
jgi:hypothetical protein